MEGGEKDVFLLLPKANKHWNLSLVTKQDVFPLNTKHGTFRGPPNMEHSKGHQSWNILRVTKLETFPRFLFSISL
jgi:hypothetical protein